MSRDHDEATCPKCERERMIEEAFAEGIWTVGSADKEGSPRPNPASSEQAPTVGPTCTCGEGNAYCPMHWYGPEELDMWDVS